MRYLSALVDTYYVAFRYFDTSVLFSPDLTEVCIILSSLAVSCTDLSRYILVLLCSVQLGSLNGCTRILKGDCSYLRVTRPLGADEFRTGNRGW